MKLNFKVIVLFVAVLAIGLMTIRLFSVLIPKKAEKTDELPGVSYLMSLESADVSAVSAAVQAARGPALPVPAAPPVSDAGKNEAPTQPAGPTVSVKDGNFRRAFQDIIISGDSIVKAIWEYDVLDKTQVLAEISAGIGYFESILDDIVAAAPRYLILHYGENEVQSPQAAVSFVSGYKNCIAQLQSRLPGTQIIVDSIFPVTQAAIKAEPYLVYIPDYNALIEQMAKELNVRYIDYTDIWNSYQTNYYDADGVHPIRSYYVEEYLPSILTEVGYTVER